MNTTEVMLIYDKKDEKTVVISQRNLVYQSQQLLNILKINVQSKKK